MRVAIWGEDGERTVAAVGRILAEAVGIPVQPEVRSPATFAGNHAYERKKLVEFARDLADDLTVFDLVVVYLDGDEPWTGRTEERRARRLLRALPDAALGVLEARARRPRGRAAAVIPYYEVEAWLYQNFDALLALAPGDPRVLAFVDRYRGDRAAIDEIPSVKRVHGVREYDRLAEAYPAGEVEAAGASFAAAIATIRAALVELRAASPRGTSAP